jgi:hypothetical protein
VNPARPANLATATPASTCHRHRVDPSPLLPPLGRPRTPEEVAEAMLRLLTDHARHVSAALLDVAGGR